jgi:very-short-patch-repair endonuclease
MAEKQLAAREMRANPTAAERRLWAVLRGGRLEGLKFRRQHVVFGFIVDFYCHSKRVAIEVDGVIHQTQAEADRERDRVLSANDILVLRYSNEQVLEATGCVLADIAHALFPEWMTLPSTPPPL